MYMNEERNNTLETTQSHVWMLTSDIDQLRNIIYRLENKILAAERRIEKLEAAERTTAKILNERSCDTCE